jgi:PadR family transcriptional regulator, regulatory protein PadR
MELDRTPLDAMLLAVVDESPVHGYAVIERLRERSAGGFDLPEGTVYPALHRLEGAGLLRASWSKTGGRRRKTYALTRKGRAALDRRRAEWQDYARTVGAVLG